MDSLLSELLNSWVSIERNCCCGKRSVASDGVAAAFVALGFPVPEKIQVMKLSHQIAQKLHAVSEPGSARAHDLIDLQLIFNNSEINLAETRHVCERLFAYRKKQPWPPKIVKGDGWDDLYLAAKGDLSVLLTADDAVMWGNDFVQRIASGAR